MDNINIYKQNINKTKTYNNAPIGLNHKDNAPLLEQENMDNSKRKNKTIESSIQVLYLSFKQI